jgi:hypothetical protein
MFCYETINHKILGWPRSFNLKTHHKLFWRTISLNQGTTKSFTEWQKTWTGHDYQCTDCHIMTSDIQIWTWRLGCWANFCSLHILISSIFIHNNFKFHPWTTKLCSQGNLLKIFKSDIQVWPWPLNLTMGIKKPE